jgi:hypothetical protein
MSIEDSGSACSCSAIQSCGATLASSYGPTPPKPGREPRASAGSSGMKTMARSLFLFLCVLLLLASTSTIDGRRAASPPSGGVETREPVMRSGLLVDFIENRGQWHGSARFVARQERLTTLLAPRAITLRLSA